jgi:hypothetical protein
MSEAAFAKASAAALTLARRSFSADGRHAGHSLTRISLRSSGLRAYRAQVALSLAQSSYRSGTKISSASCSFVSGAEIYLNATASAIDASMPSIRSGTTLFFG